MSTSPSTHITYLGTKQSPHEPSAPNPNRIPPNPGNRRPKTLSQNPIPPTPAPLARTSPTPIPTPPQTPRHHRRRTNTHMLKQPAHPAAQTSVSSEVVKHTSLRRAEHWRVAGPREFTALSRARGRKSNGLGKGPNGAAQPMGVRACG